MSCRAVTWQDLIGRVAPEYGVLSISDRLYDVPEMDLYADFNNHQLPLFVTQTHERPARSPDAFMVDWTQWNYLVLEFVLPP